ncbi:MAG: MATE family efflux transporter, partial [Acidobacteriota bacterium]|nr:MATE family efflux transporter [Acidobacteriota bacterium]
AIALRDPLGDAGFGLLSGPAGVEEAGRLYYDARIWGAPAAFANLALVGWFLGRGEAARALLLVVLANLGNIALNWWFIVHLGWAAFGAGLATAGAQWLSAAAGLILALAAAGPLPAWPTLFDRDALRQILALSGHLVIRTLLLVTAFAVFTNASALFGAARLAFAGETLAGMAFGAGDRRELRRVLLLTLAAAVGCAIVFLVPALAFPDAVYGLLVDHEDVAALAAESNVWLLPVLLFAALAYAFDGFFLGLTRGKLLSRAMAVSLGVGFAPLAWAAVHFRDPDLLWLSMAGLMAARAATLGYAARRYLVPDRGGA